MYVRTRISASHSELKAFLLMTLRNFEATHKLQKKYTYGTSAYDTTYEATCVRKERQATTCLILIAF